MSEENKDLGDKAEAAFDKAKEAAKDLKEDVKETFSSDNPDKGKNIAIIAHFTLIGWIIALVMNNDSKTELGSFYIRQVLGLGLLGILLSIIPIIGWLASFGVIVLWLMSLIAAIGGEKKLTPVLGEYFQDWFKSL